MTHSTTNVAWVVSAYSKVFVKSKLFEWLKVYLLWTDEYSVLIPYFLGHWIIACSGGVRSVQWEGGGREECAVGGRGARGV